LQVFSAFTAIPDHFPDRVARRLLAVVLVAPTPVEFAPDIGGHRSRAASRISPLEPA
jgi:hypothetical protein